MPPSKVPIKIGIEQTRSKGERNGSRSANLPTAPPAAPSAWLTTFNATRSVLQAVFGTTEGCCPF
jgi:hypothetical protein